MRISHYAVHVGHSALEKTVEKYHAAGLDQNRAIYTAMVENLNSTLGSVLDKLNSLGIADETFVVFTSDNGDGFRRTGPLRGGKASLWEGGIRVPTVICGPKVPSGTYCDIPIVGWDFLLTFYELAGGDKLLPKELDSGSLRSLLENGNQGTVQRNVEPLVFYYPWYDSVPMSVIRQSDYKLVKDLNTDQTLRFNVVDYIGESNDLSDKMPQLKQVLLAKMTAYLAEVKAEDLTELRTDREQWLNDYISRDEKAIMKLESLMASAAGIAVRQELAGKIEDIQRRTKNNHAVLQRVATGRHLTAW